MRKALFIFFMQISVSGFCQNKHTTEFVIINGKKVAYSISGLQTRKPGEPLVVFENGAATYKENFDTLFNYLPKNIAWLTYDRPGVGQSQEDTTLQNDVDIVKRLHNLLKSVKAAPPYLLVGHSYGGPLIRLFTALYPTEVNGLVFIDPTPFMWTQQDEENLKLTSNNSIGWVGMQEKMFELMSADKNMPSGIRAEMKRLVYKDITTYFADYRSLPPLPNIPITVFIAYNAPSNPQQETMLKQWHLNDAFLPRFDQMRISSYLKFMENNSKASVICLPKFTHYMHVQDPKVIASATQTVYYYSLKEK
jgi:pimeloyl-ACP methyl ester carboxylesterase